MGKLTETMCKRATWEGRNYHLTDGGGLSLEVREKSKLWRWQYRYHGEKRLSAFGEFPAVSLAAARDKHIDGRRLLDKDIDPRVERKSDKIVANTFESVAWAWFETWKHGREARYVEQQEARLKANILPALGARPVEGIEAPDVVAMAKAVERRGAIDLAYRSIQVAQKIFSYAIQHGLAKRNPAADVKPADVLKARSKQNHKHVDTRELPALLAAIDGYSGKQTRLAMQLITLTFVRTIELVGAKWSEIDLEGAQWDIPKERMKMKRPHIVPLPRQAVAIIRELRQMSKGEYVFPGSAGKAHMSTGTMSGALKRLNYRGKMTVHGVRHTASTWLHENDFNGEHIEMQLSHAKADKVAGTYNKAAYLSQRKALMQAWADHLDSLTVKLAMAAD
ncbi:MAG: tyrosine-type recombinase/integrase [Terracidiphilus sp.]